MFRPTHRLLSNAAHELLIQRDAWRRSADELEERGPTYQRRANANRVRAIELERVAEWLYQQAAMAPSNPMPTESEDEP